MKKDKNKKKTRFVTVSYRGIKGIRKDTQTGKFVVEKCIRGERYSATLTTLAEAGDWKKNFHPGLNWQPLASLQQKKEGLEKRFSDLGLEIKRPIGVQKNGNDFGYTFGDVWEMYVAKHLSKLEGSTFETCAQRAKSFYNRLMKIPMVEMTADEISTHLKIKKNAELKKKSSKRYNFNNDLKEFKALFNWYRERIDALFVNPVLKRHKVEGEIRKIPKRHKKMRRHELQVFFNALGGDGQFWRDLAETQFYFSGRVQEVAGLQWDSVDFIDGVINIENVAVWGRSDRNFHYLKDSPKNGEDRPVPMTQKLRTILERRFKEQRPSKFQDRRTEKFVPCNFVFHQEGKPLQYRYIQYRYNKALKQARLDHKFASTHILRHSMANLVRERLGIEHAQAVGGWKSRDMVEHVYTERPAHLTEDALRNIEAFISSVALKPLPSGRGCEATPFGENKKYCLLKNIIIYWICRNKNRPTVGTTGCEARGDDVRPRNLCSRRLSVKQESPSFREG